MQLKRVTNGDIVIKYKVTMDRGLGAQPPAAGHFCDFAAKKKQFLRHFNRTSHVLKTIRITTLLKFRSYFKEELNFFAPLAPPYFRSSLKYV